MRLFSRSLTRMSSSDKKRENAALEFCKDSIQGARPVQREPGRRLQVFILILEIFQCLELSTSTKVTSTTGRSPFLVLLARRTKADTSKRIFAFLATILSVRRLSVSWPKSGIRIFTKMVKVRLFSSQGTLSSNSVCISILHPPVDDVQGGELPGERWNPTQSVRTILLSIISVLNDPNTFSPANVDASVAFRNWKEGKNTKYIDMIKAQVL